MNGDALQQLIRNCSLFAGLSDEAYRDLEKAGDVVRLASDATLFKQGDSSDSLYVLISGQLSVTLAIATGELKVVGTVQPGEVVGELGALTGERRTASVEADEDSTLFCLSNTEFIDLAHTYPSILFKTLPALLARSRQTLKLLSQESARHHVALVKAHPGVDITGFLEVLERHIAQSKDLVFVPAADLSRAEEYLADAHDTHRIAVFALDDEHGDDAAKVLGTIVRFYVIADEHATPRFSGRLIEAIQKNELADVRKDIIITHATAQPVATNTKPWTQHIAFSMYHHVGLNCRPDLERLTRFVSGKATGLVMGGGGAKGWVHIGAIRALEECGVTIDAVGGTSIGALSSGCFALHRDYRNTYALFRKVALIVLRFQDATWPAVSLSSGKNFTRALMDAFKDIHLEDLWLPTYCITTDIQGRREVVHNTGPVWQKLRASMSLPGVVPPVVMDGRVHTDGGSLNNLPVDIMRTLLGASGKIITVKISGGEKESRVFDFPPIISPIMGFLSRYSKTPQFVLPKLGDLFYESLIVAQYRRANDNSQMSDVLIGPDMRGFTIIDFKNLNEKPLTEIGYTMGKELIEKWLTNSYQESD